MNLCIRVRSTVYLFNIFHQMTVNHLKYHLHFRAIFTLTFLIILWVRIKIVQILPVVLFFHVLFSFILFFHLKRTLVNWMFLFGLWRWWVTLCWRPTGGESRPDSAVHFCLQLLKDQADIIRKCIDENWAGYRRLMIHTIIIARVHVGHPLNSLTFIILTRICIRRP